MDYISTRDFERQGWLVVVVKADCKLKFSAVYNLHARASDGVDLLDTFESLNDDDVLIAVAHTLFKPLEEGQKALRYLNISYSDIDNSMTFITAKGQISPKMIVRFEEVQQARYIMWKNMSGGKRKLQHTSQEKIQMF